MQTGLMSAEGQEVGILAAGSSAVVLTDREDQVARLLSLGYQHKRIASMVGISQGTVSTCIARLAERIPGNGNPTVKVTVWYLEYRS